MGTEIIVLHLLVANEIIVEYDNREFFFIFAPFIRWMRLQ